MANKNNKKCQLKRKLSNDPIDKTQADNIGNANKDKKVLHVSDDSSRGRVMHHFFIFIFFFCIWWLYFIVWFVIKTFF